MSFSDNAKVAARVIIGLVIAGAALYLGYAALHEHPINLRLVEIAAGGLILAGLVGDADPIYDAAKKLLSLLPSIKVGGNGTPPP